jgi:hypothetical protein
MAGKPKLPSKERIALVTAIIGACVAIAVALINIVPSFRKSEVPATAPPTSVTNNNGTGSQLVINGGQNVLQQPQQDHLVADILTAGLPAMDHPIVDLSKPIEEQLQLFPEDRIKYTAGDTALEHMPLEIWVGHEWRPLVYGGEYVAWGKPDTPITPRIRNALGPLTCSIKFEVTFTKYRDKPRDLHSSENGPAVSVAKP